MSDHAGRSPADVALALLAEQGFDATSTGQIAQAIGMPEADVVAAIGTKEAVVLDVARSMLADVVGRLCALDPQTPVVEALLAAHAAVLNDIIDGDGPITFEQLRHMGKTITSSPDLQKKVSAQRREVLADVLADHFGRTTADREVQRGLKLWSAVLAATYLDVLDKQGHFDPEVDAETPESMRVRLNRAFHIVTGRPTGA